MFGRPIGIEGKGGIDSFGIIGIAGWVGIVGIYGSGGKLGFGNADGIVGSPGTDCNKWRAASHFPVLLVMNMAITPRIKMQLL